MKWTKEAETELEKVPRFVRSMAKKAIEKAAREKELDCVTPDVVLATKEKYFSLVGKEKEGGKEPTKIAVVRCHTVAEGCSRANFHTPDAKASCVSRIHLQIVPGFFHIFVLKPHNRYPLGGCTLKGCCIVFLGNVGNLSQSSRISDTTRHMGNDCISFLIPLQDRSFWLG